MCSLDVKIGRARTLTQKQAIRAYKVFRTGRDESLCSLNDIHPVTYSGNRVFQAAGYRRKHGFYCFKTRTEAVWGRRRCERYGKKTIQPVLIWGLIHEHFNGYRAQFLKLAVRRRRGAMVLAVAKVGEPTRKWALKISRSRMHVHRLQSDDKGSLSLLGPPPALEVLCARMCGRSEARVPRHAIRSCRSRNDIRT